jgi:adenosylcobinamide-GDP ribazoletransferase
MSATTYLRKTCIEFLSAVQFLTRIPMPSLPCEADSLARSVKFFPLVGALIGGGAALLQLFLSAHLPRLAAAFFVLLYSILITGGLHEDGMADAADGFGGGRSREQILLIMRDSRIGAYGGVALALSLTGRLILIASLPLPYARYYLIAAAVLARWTVLPLSHYLPPARTSTPGQTDGQGARIARLTSTGSLIAGTLFSFGITVLLLQTHSIAPILASIALASFTGLYYKRRIGGATGDCYGATLQLSELGVYLCGAWTL